MLENSGPGARGENKAMHTYTVRGLGEKLVHSNDAIFSVTALLNGMAVFFGNDIVALVQRIWTDRKPKIKGLTDLTLLMHGMKT